MAQIHVRSMLVAFVFRGALEEQDTEQMEERPSWQKKLGVRGKQPKKKQRELKDARGEERVAAYGADNAENKGREKVRGTKRETPGNTSETTHSPLFISGRRIN